MMWESVTAELSEVISSLHWWMCELQFGDVDELVTNEHEWLPHVRSILVLVLKQNISHGNYD